MERGREKRDEEGENRSREKERVGREEISSERRGWRKGRWGE